MKQVKLPQLPLDAKPIPSLPSYYATPDGRIFRETYGKGNPNFGGNKNLFIIELSQNSVSNSGYKLVQPYLNSKKRVLRYVHHLITETFLGPKPEGLVVDHIDRHKLNNHIDNLRYVTQTTNMKNCNYKPVEFRKSHTGKYKTLRKDILSLRSEGYSITKIAEMLDIPVNYIYFVRFNNPKI
jgi:hypothetical protein